MSNLRKIREIRKIKRNRKNLERAGALLLGVGFFLCFGISGEGCTLSLGKIFLIGLIGMALAFLGVVIINLVDYVNKEYPLNCNLKAEGDDLWYDMYKNEVRCND